jgi:hypothetical protein
LVSLTAPLLAVMRPLNRQLAYSDATRAHFGHREHPDRSMLNAQIGAS